MASLNSKELIPPELLSELRQVCPKSTTAAGDSSSDDGLAVLLGAILRYRVFVLLFLWSGSNEILLLLWLTGALQVCQRYGVLWFGSKRRETGRVFVRQLCSLLVSFPVQQRVFDWCVCCAGCRTCLPK